VFIPVAIGWATSAIVLVGVTRRCLHDNHPGSDSTRIWWTQHGQRLMLLTSVPTYVAIAGATMALNRH
jgi:hypothetical protein